MKKLIHELPGGSYRDATSEEIQEARNQKRQLKQLRKKMDELKKEIAKLEKCPHKVAYDEEGFPYNVRICLACGNRSLL